MSNFYHKGHKGFALIPALFVLVLLNASVIIVCDYTLNTLRITYSIKKGFQDYVESYSKQLINIGGGAVANVNTADKWIISTSHLGIIPDWDYLLKNSYRCAENIIPEIDSDFITTLSSKTCTSVIFDKNYTSRAIGNIWIDNLKIESDELVNGYAQIINSGTIRILNLDVNVPTLIISASGVQIDKLTGNSKVFILAAQEIDIKQNFIPHLTRNYKNFHLLLDQIQLEPIAIFIKTLNPPIYGFWFNRHT